ncbi:IS66 family insertion sequence element accessory protein TnpB [Bacteroides uniformis]|jgi:transposase
MLESNLEQWSVYSPKRSGLSWSVPSDPKTGDPMLSVTDMNCFYYLCGFTDMRCKHPRVLFVIREQLHREPSDGDIYIVMSKDRRIVRLFAYDNRSYSLFEKKFVSGYQFMRIIKDDEGNAVAYRIDWKDVVLLLENPVIKSLKIDDYVPYLYGYIKFFCIFISQKARYGYGWMTTVYSSETRASVVGDFLASCF